MPTTRSAANGREMAQKFLDLNATLSGLGIRPITGQTSVQECPARRFGSTRRCVPAPGQASRIDGADLIQDAVLCSAVEGAGNASGLGLPLGRHRRNDHGVVGAVHLIRRDTDVRPRFRNLAADSGIEVDRRYVKRRKASGAGAFYGTAPLTPPTLAHPTAEALNVVEQAIITTFRHARKCFGPAGTRPVRGTQKQAIVLYG